MFESAQVGDRVWDFTRGWGTIDGLWGSDIYSISVKFSGDSCSFTVSGKYHVDDINPSLFWDELKFDIPAIPKKVKKYRWVQKVADSIFITEGYFSDKYAENDESFLTRIDSTMIEGEG